MANLQVCPFHTDEDVAGTSTSQVGILEYTCTRAGHPRPGPHRWVAFPEPPPGVFGSGVAAELNLAVELPAAVGKFAGRWVEYGVVEHAYAQANPQDFAELIDRYGHTAVAAKQFTASAFLARAMGDLTRYGSLLYHPGPATGRWSYNSAISWWAVAPEPDWSQRLSWTDTGLGMSYVPGNIEE